MVGCEMAKRLTEVLYGLKAKYTAVIAFSNHSLIQDNQHTGVYDQKDAASIKPDS